MGEVFVFVNTIFDNLNFCNARFFWIEQQGFSLSIVIFRTYFRRNSTTELTEVCTRSSLAVPSPKQFFFGNTYIKCKHFFLHHYTERGNASIILLCIALLIKNLVLKVRKSWKQILKFSSEPKNEQEYFCISAIASKSGQIMKM